MCCRKLKIRIATIAGRPTNKFTELLSQLKILSVISYQTVLLNLKSPVIITIVILLFTVIISGRGGGPPYSRVVEIRIINFIAH